MSHELPGPRFTAASTSTVTHTLVFKANDGMVDSIDTYTVELTWIQPAVTFRSQGVVDLAHPTDLVYTADQPGLLNAYDVDAVRFDITPTFPVLLPVGNIYGIDITWNKSNGTLTIDKSIFAEYLEQSKIAEQQGAPMPSLVAGAYKVTIIFDNGWEYSTTSALTGAFPEPLATYTITYNNGGGSGTMSSGTATEGVAFTLPDCTFTPPADKEFKAWLIGGVEYAEGAKYTFTAATTVTAVWKDEAVTPPPVNNDPPEEPTSPSWRPSSDDDNDDDSTYTAPRLPALTEQWMTAANLTNPSRSTLRFGVRVSAWNALTGQYYHDSIRGKIVEARTYFENPGLFTRDSYVSGWTNGADVDKNRALFEKWYTNPIRAIHFDQPGKWENPIKVAARVDLAGMDTTRLVFYYYDPKLNSYRKLAAPAYWVDANGYLRFQTEYAGEIIISEGELEKK